MAFEFYRQQTARVVAKEVDKLNVHSFGRVLDTIETFSGGKIAPTQEAILEKLNQVYKMMENQPPGPSES